MNKENDLFLNMVANPDFTLEDFMAVGLTADNTGIDTEESYKSNSHVQNYFKTESGTFDESKYHNAYLLAQMQYGIMSTQEYNKAMEKQGQYHRDNILVPAYQRRQDPDLEFTKIPNPLLQQRSIISLGRSEDPKLSIEEIAQTQKVYDPKTGEWHDSPNESFFTDFWETRVLAQYDSDGTHIDPITGDEVEHKANEYKLNADGKYYYENLNGRSVYGKTVLNKMNTLTTDGSFANKYDFFDSDDLEQKSIGGQVMKELALVGTMFLPYIGPYIATLSIATQSAGFLSTLGKMFLGSDSPTLSSIEGWVKSVDRQTAKTDYAKQNTWCWENFLSLIGDVAAQLREQRIIFKDAPALFKGGIGKTNKAQEEALQKWTKEFQDNAVKNLKKDIDLKKLQLANQGKQVEFNEIQAFAESQANSAMKAQAKLDSYMKGYNKIGEILSKTYMTAITVEDMYGEAKLAGASDLEATLLTLGYAAGEAWILNTGIGEHILPELRDERYRTRKLIEVLTNKSAKKVTQGSTKSEKFGFLKDWFNKGKKIAIEDYTLGKRILPSMFAHGLGEGVEETSEELLADFSRACFNTVQWLQNDETRLSIDNIFDRYSMSFLGGIVGGAINAPFVTNHRSIKNYDNLTPHQAIQELTYMIRNGKEKDLIKILKKTDVGDRNLSQTKTVEDSKGNIIYAAAENYEDSQDYAIKKAVIDQVQYIKDFLKAEGADISDESFLNTNTLGDLRYSVLQNSATAGKYLQTFNSLSSQLYELIKQQDESSTAQTDMQERAERHREENGTQTSEDIIRQEKREKLKTQIEEKRKELKDLISGKRAPEFIADSLFEMIPAINNVFTKPSFIQYAEYSEKKKFSEIPDNIKAKLKTDYINWLNTEGKDDIHLKSQIYLEISKKLSDIISQHRDFYNEKSELTESLLNLYKQLENEPRSEDEWLSEAQSITANISQLIELLGESSSIKERVKQLKESINISPDATLEEKQIISKNYFDNLNELIATNISEIFDPFIEKGYINSEIKNSLNQILDRVNLYINYKINEENLFDKYGPLLIKISDYKSKINNLNESPIEQILNQVSLSLTNNGINFKKLFDKINKIFYSKQQDISEFAIDSDLKQSLKESLDVLELYKSIINGAKTDNVKFGISESGKDATDLWGYNKTLNEVNKLQKTENWEDLVELNSDTANIIINDINLLYKRLNFLKTLYEINEGQKLAQNVRVSLNKDYIFYNKMKKFIITIPDEFKGKSELLGTLNSLFTLKKNYKDKNFNLTEEQKENIERERIKMEDAIYDFFQVNSDMTVEQLAKLISTDNLNLFHRPEELLSEELDDLDDNSFVWWIATRAAVKASDFYNMYKQIIDDKIAPIPIQELATYLNYASVIKGNTISKFYNAFRLSIKEGWKKLSVDKRNKINPPGILNEDQYTDYINSLPIGPMYQNIVLTEGIPGSGKTTAVLKSTIKLLQKFNKEILSDVYIIHGADVKQTTSGEKLSNGLGLKSSKVLTRESLMKIVSQDWKEFPVDSNGQVQITNDDYYFDQEKDIRRKLNISEIANPPSLIIIDEISKFNSLDLEMLDRFARKYGITILTAGDFDQSGAYGRFDIQLNETKVGGVLESSRQDFIRSPKLGVSLRTANSQKTSNLKLFQTIFKLKEGNLNLHYYQDDTGIYGDKAYFYNENGDGILNFKKITDDIDLMIASNPNEKIGYIYYSKDTELYKLLESKYSDKIEFFYGGSAQGLEGTYYIIENDPNKDTIDYLKDLYTGLSRSMKGSIVITKSIIDDRISIDTTLDTETHKESIGDQAIKNYSIKRKELLEKIIISGNEVKYEKRESENKVIPPTNNNDGLSQGLKDPDESLPIINTEEQNEAYKDKIDKSSESDPIPVEDLLDGIILHSFNTFESGIEKDNDGNVRQYGSSDLYQKRIDSINGLIYLFNKLDTIYKTNPDKTNPLFQQYKDFIYDNGKFKYDKCMSLLGLIRNILLNNSDKNTAIQNLQKYLPIEKGYITFAIKSVAISKTNEFGSTNPKYAKFTQSTKEELDFIYSNDEYSKIPQQKKIVAIIGDEEVGDLLEIPLLSLTNPFTLIQLKDQENYLFEEAYKIFIKNNEDIFKSGTEIINTLKNDPKYTNLINLITLYRYTSNGVFFNGDPTWMPAQMKQLGPQFVQRKGRYNVEKGREYNADWISINELAKNPSIKISDILTASSPYIDGIDQPVVQAGHPFVLVSFDKDIINLAEYYVNQLKDPENYPKKVKLVYVLPPSVTVLKYIDNVYNIIHNSGYDAKPIGNIKTSYKILSELFQNNKFIEFYSKEFGKDKINFVKQIIDSLKDVDEQTLIKELKKASDWVSIGGLNTLTLSQQFDGFLKSLVYPTYIKNITESEVKENKEYRDFLEEILSTIQIKKVYYRSVIKPAEQQVKNDPFYQIIQDHYTFNGSPFLIHGKIDSPAFFADINSWIKDIVESKIYYKEDSTVPRSRDNETYINGNSNIFSNTDPDPKWFIDLKARLKYLGYDNKLKDLDKNTPLKNIADQINSDSTIPSIALVIDNKLYISDKNDMFETKINNLRLYDGNQFTYTDSNNTEYNVIFDTTTNSAEFTEVIKNQNVDLDENSLETYNAILPQSFDNIGDLKTYLESNKNSLLNYLKEQIEDYDGESKHYIQDLINYLNNQNDTEIILTKDDISKLIQDLGKSNNRIIKTLLKKFNGKEDDEILQMLSDLHESIINIIIDNIQKLDPKFIEYFKFILNKKEKSNSKNTCPTTIKIKF